MRLCQRMAPMGWDSPVAGRAGKKHVSFRNLMGLSAPHHELLFARAKSNQKHAQEGDTFDCVPLLRTTPRNDTKGGARPLLDFPARLLLVLLFFGCSRGCDTRTMLRLAPLETCPPFTGPEAGVSLIDPL